MSEDTAISTYNNNQTYKKHFCGVVQKHWRQEEKEKQRHRQLQSFLTNTQKQKKNIPDFLVHRRLAQAHKQATYNYWYSERGISRIIFLIASVESFEPSFKQFFSEDSLPCGINVYDGVCFGK